MLDYQNKLHGKILLELCKKRCFMFYFIYLITFFGHLVYTVKPFNWIIYYECCSKDSSCRL